MKDKDIKLLSICFPPPMYYSLHVAISLSIILSNKDNHKWFYNNFIQVSFYNGYYKEPSGHAYDIYPASKTRPGQFAASQFLVEKHMDQNIFDFVQEDLIANIIKFVNEGYYVSSIVDVSKLKGTCYEHKDFIVHGIMILGYNLDRKTFYILDFDNKNKISVIEILFNDYYHAFSSENLKSHFKSNLNNSIILFEIKKNNYYFNLEVVKEMLNDYINSYNTSKRYTLFLPCDENSTWGFATYDKLKEYLITVNGNIDYRMFHAFYEHKRIMSERFLFFYDNKILNVGNKNLRQLKNNENLADLIRKLVLKYNHTNKNNLILKIIQYMNVIKNNEGIVYKDISKRISDLYE